MRRELRQVASLPWSAPDVTPKQNAEEAVSPPEQCSRSIRRLLDEWQYAQCRCVAYVVLRMRDLG